MNRNLKKGVVTIWYARGFGFAVDADQKQFYLHVNNLVNPRILPRQGDIIEFEIGEPQRQGGLPEAIHAAIVPPLPAIAVEPLWGGK